MSPMIDHVALQGLDLTAYFPKTLVPALAGGLAAFFVEDITGSYRSLFVDAKMRSFLQLPVTVAEKLWGSLSFIASSNAFMSSADIGGFDIISSNALRSGTSISDTTVQYRSAQKSVMIRMRGIPERSASAFIALYFSTNGRTLPGLQYMRSRMMYMTRSRSEDGWTLCA
jgi:hypothetical protein